MPNETSTSDAFQLLTPAGAILEVVVDASQAMAALDRAGGQSASGWSAVLVRAAAGALAASPGIALRAAVAGSTPFAAPVAVEGAAGKTLAALVEEIARAATPVPVPGGSLGWFARRRMRAELRRAAAGCLVVASVDVDTAAAMRAAAPAMLVAGRPVDRVVVRDGQPAVRPTMTLNLSVTDASLDLAAAGAFLARVREELERAESASAQPGAGRAAARPTPVELRRQASKLLSRVASRQLTPEAALEQWPELGADPALDDAWHQLVNYRYDADARRGDPDLDKVQRDALTQASERLSRLSAPQAGRRV